MYRALPAHTHSHMQYCTHINKKLRMKQKGKQDAAVQTGLPLFILLPPSLHPSFYWNHMRKECKHKSTSLPTPLLVKYITATKTAGK